ncbi:thioredoxin domain-containing protein [Plastoroseomonas hellenica]|uniref:thioredoxin domain-containing protein n=1 Tax=Plastoroseomonas hellenica TaxID=2687306 RepID=UPI001BAB3E64|nr:thioredoxin domain-containing protein [Plastoroseomonas hellenica]MBR0647181.1 thioredoxin domain-containing protein [Plastoroseomonas hellenica]
MTTLPPENLLRHASSPYLQQHAGNPVHWRPWGEAALAEARSAGKPILLSVGYAACHWCHVMAHESFEDAETAALMNALYVNIKLDREERPDIDALYMNALHMLGEQGGWPLTMFLTPKAEPFWGGTYFPPEPRWGRPSFRQVLSGVAEAFRQDGAKVAQNVAALKGGLAKMAAATPGPLPTAAQLNQVALGLVRATDAEEGGLAGAPKFPNPPIFRFLWQMGFRLQQPACAEATHLLLRKMSQGGIYDHLGGGYARYSTDAIWLAPHFEKMLYDNAQILELLALAHAAAPNPLYAERAAQTVDWLAREMLAEDGAFAATEDADTEGEEGRFYVWSKPEIDALLPPEDAALFARVYDVTEEGNWEHKTILNRRGHPAPLSPAEEARLDACRATLFAARARRPAPGRDDKVLADWNGLMIAALTRAGTVFGRPDWLVLAERAFVAILRHHAAPDGRLHHAWRAGRVTAPGLLEDQAAMARAALALHEATGGGAYLAQAIAWAEATHRHFAAPEGGHFTSADDAGDILVRGLTAADNATPAGNGIQAEVEARLFHLTGEPRWREAAERSIGAFAGHQALAAMPGLLAAADLLTEGAAVVVAGPETHPATRALLATALAHPDPALAVLRASGALPATHPAHGKGMLDGSPAAYVCRHGTCALPVTDPASLAGLLDRPT